MKVHTLQINYRSGISMQADFTQFEIKNGKYSWTSHNANTPVVLGVDNIESVWQLSIREVEEDK